MENSEEERSLYRAEALARRADTSEKLCEELSASLNRHISSLSSLYKINVLAGFWGVRGEPRINPALETLKQNGLRIALPVTLGEELQFREAENFDVSGNVCGPFGIPEPRGPVIKIKQIDAFLVPGLVFDESGGRLGYGKGYYDRALSMARPDALLFGVGFRRDIMSVLPTRDYDIRMNVLITDSGTVSCRAGTGNVSAWSSERLDP